MCVCVYWYAERGRHALVRSCSVSEAHDTYTGYFIMQRESGFKLATALNVKKVK